MTNLHDIFMAQRLPQTVHDMFIAENLFLKYKQEQVSGIVPLTLLDSVGKPLASYSITGATEQEGSPVEVRGVGIKTGNLLNDSQFKDATVNLKYFPLFVGNGTFTLSCDIPPYGSDKLSDVFLLSDNVKSGASSTTNGANSTKSITTASRNGYITVAYRNSYFTKLSEHKIMLNEGSEPLPYEQFGYKIPILLNSEDYSKQTISSTIYVDKPLYSGDKLSYPQNERTNADGTTEPITLPEIPTLAGTNVLSVQTEVQPASITVKYYKKN